MNLTISWYSGAIEDGEELTSEDFEKVMKDNLELYEIVNIENLNLDTNKNIYVVQNGNYQVHGSPKDYLTNNIEFWNSKNKYQGRNNKEWWIKRCIVSVDPELSELDDIENEDSEDDE